MSTLTKIAVCSLLVLAITPLAFAGDGDGGNSGGGGNTNRPQIANIQDVYKSINKAHSSRLMMAYAWQRQALFPLPNKYKSFASLFDQIKLNKPADACLDAGHKRKDGSADIQKMEICLSAPRIVARQIPLKLLDIKVAALYAHEASHLLNQNEATAVALQKRVEQTLIASNFSFDSLKKSRTTGLLDLIGDAFEGWQTIVDSNPSDQLGLCDNTNEIANLIFETDGLIYDEQKQYGTTGQEAYRLTSLSEDYLWEAFRTRGFLIGLTCASKTNSARSEYENIFSNTHNTPQPVQNLMCRFNTPMNCADMSRAPRTAVNDVSFIRRGNRQDVLAETMKMEKIRLDLIGSFKRPILR